jgi:pimeloyl-ACP methyl ester carboxylesterase
MPDAAELRIHTDDGVTLSGEDSGPTRPGTPIVLLHGLTATRRYVVMGSRTLSRQGYRVIAYDARGHGRSAAPADGRAYGYERLARDLEEVLDTLGLQRAVLAGASMGAHTAVRFALHRPERVLGLGLITPSFDPALPLSDAVLAGWDALARELRDGGVEGFVDAYDFSSLPIEWRDTVEKVIRQRLSAHEHPEAVARALEVVPRSRPFEQLEELTTIAAPTLVVASRDGADPSHPLAVGERYASAIPAARLIVEDAGPPIRSPIAWQGGQLSRALAELASNTPPAN